ncbi:hypothetical protein [Limosilactobacillus antri]|uniref:hypothetical protein n=1 Tax=Limosilactobacillus antri TaxID=227943 RepID=UPI001F59F4FC|nr:hypothetical protein [Limosilactobacillus antri]
MNEEPNNVIDMTTYKPKKFVNPSTPVDNENTGGGSNMDDKYVTHKEFDGAMHNIDKHFDHIDTKFAEQTLSLYKAMISIGLGVIAILSFLITLVTFLK